MRDVELSPSRGDYASRFNHLPTVRQGLYRNLHDPVTRKIIVFSRSMSNPIWAFDVSLIH